MSPPLRLLVVLLLSSHILPATAAVNDAVRVSTWGQKVPLPSGTLWTPTALAVDSVNGLVFTVEPLRITKWTRAGNLVSSWACSCVGVEVSDVTHHVYATSWTQDAVFEFDEFGNPVRQWGGLGSGPGQFREPFGIAVDPTTGEVYVADPGNQRVQIFDSSGVYLREIKHTALSTFPGEPMSVAFDPATRTLWVTNPGDNTVLQFDETGTIIRQLGTVQPAMLPGRFRWPRSVALAADGRVFVTDTDSERVQYFSPSGDWLGVLQGPNNVKDGPFHPRDLGLDLLTGELFVLAAYANRVDRFGSDLQYQLSFGRPRTDGPRFLLPRGIAVSPLNGDLYIADTANFVIKRATPGGAVLGQFGGSWNIDHGASGIVGSFDQSALTTDPDGNVWAGYNGIHYPDDPPVQFVQRFDPMGGHLSSFFRAPPEFVRFERVSHVAVDPVTRHVWVADANGWVDRFNAEGFPLDRIGSFGIPTGIAISGEFVYVADRGGAIHRLDGLSNQLTFAAPGTGPGQLQLSDSSGLATDAAGNVYVADSLNHRIQEFAPDGTFLGSLGQFGNSPGQFNQPRALAFSPDYSLMHVVEYATHRVQSFCMPGFSLGHCLAQLDDDGDTVVDAADNCPFAPNVDQLNSGGLNTAVPDAYGNACQCGAVQADGIVGAPDLLLMRRWFAGAASIDPALCSVYGDEDCDLVDAVVLARALAGRNPSLSQNCSAAQRSS